MIVHRKALVGVIVHDLPAGGLPTPTAKEARIGCKIGDPGKAQLLRKEPAIELGAGRIAVRQAGNGSMQAIGRQHNVIGLAQPAADEVKFAVFIGLVHWQLDVAIPSFAQGGRPASLYLGEGQGQVIVPMLDGDHSAVRHILIDPPGCLYPGVRLGVHSGKRQRIEHGQG